MSRDVDPGGKPVRRAGRGNALLGIRRRGAPSAGLDPCLRGDGLGGSLPGEGGAAERAERHSAVPGIPGELRAQPGAVRIMKVTLFDFQEGALEDLRTKLTPLGR